MRALANETPPAATSLAEHIDQNIESVAQLHRRESETVRPSLRWVERVGRFIGRPIYLLAVITLSLLWVVINLLGDMLHTRSWDPPPFGLLDGIMTFISLITTTIVLISQNRQTKLEKQHAHLDLQVNLLTEQKVTKLIRLIEELRRDLPMVRDRHDAQAAALEEPADTAQVLSAISQVGLASDASAPNSQATSSEKKV
jgi:uncharacterized membrane protein